MPEFRRKAGFVTLSSILAALLLGLFPLPSFAGDANSADNQTAYSSTGKWVLTWSDEFNGPDGSPPDPKKWVYDTGGGGWGNRELEIYTNRQENVQIRDGKLVITALRENSNRRNGGVSQYTSGRINTRGLFSQKYGRFEARIKLPAGHGLWPAFWMMGDNIGTIGWPACGETDIMENIGSAPAAVHGSLHGPDEGRDSMVTTVYRLPRGRLTDDYHLYAVEWEPGSIRFYLDDTLYESRTASDMRPGAWVFDQAPMFVILNLAVGGTWPGTPRFTTNFPRQMLVDYVRVYKRE